MDILRNKITKKLHFAELDETLSNYEVYQVKNKDTYKVMKSSDKKLLVFKFIIIQSTKHSEFLKFEDSCKKLQPYSLFCVPEVKQVNPDILQCIEPYFPNGTLVDNYKQNDKIQKQQIIEICAILNKTSSLNILIGNLKPNNILFDDESYIVLCDSCQYLFKSKNQNPSIDEMKYLSPEMLENKDIDISSDIWSLGCVIYFIKSGKHMFNNPNLLVLMKKIKDCEYEKLQDNNISELLEHMIVYDKNKRYKISDINEYLEKIKVISSENRIICLPTSENDNESIDYFVDKYNDTKDRDIFNLLISKRFEGCKLIVQDKIADAVISSININVISINDKLYASDILKEISKNIKIYDGIKEIEIEKTILDKNDIQILSDIIIPQLKNLETLSIKEVCPTTSFQLIIKTQLIDLTFLDLSGNNFTLEDSIELKNSLIFIPNLEYLYLRNITIYEIIEAIPQLKHLKKLDICGNAVSEIEIEEIDELIKYNHLLYICMNDKFKNLSKQAEWIVFHENESSITKVTRSIHYSSNNNSLTSVLQPFAKVLDTLVVDLSNITDKCLKEIAEIPSTYIRIKNIQFSHLYLHHYFTSNGLMVLLPLLSSQIITMEIFITYCIYYLFIHKIDINELNIKRDKEFFKNLEKMSKYKEIEEIIKIYIL